MSSYRDTMLGELRLLECYGIERELPPALDWTPRRAVLDRIVAKGLQLVDRAAAPWSFRHGWRRMQREMLKGLEARAGEWNLYNVTESEEVA